MSTPAWILLGTLYLTVAAAVARLLPIAVSRSFPTSERWYGRLPAPVTAILHGVGGLLWPLVGAAALILLVRRR